MSCALVRIVRRLAFAGILATLALAPVQRAAALSDFGPIELQSIGSKEQFESAGEAAISADGRYLAFEGTLAGVRGIYRKDLQSGQVQLVAAGSIYEDSGATDSSAPSISADGRYVSFTSATALVKGAQRGSNVYVRDMEVPAPKYGGCTLEEEQRENGKQCAYELASALNGSVEGLTYGGQGAIGAVASGRVALSASGREVVFVIRGMSDLISHEPENLSTPSLQVVVRYLDSDTTMLVSQTLSSLGSVPQPVEGGAVTPTVRMGTVESTMLPGASLSADGSTVAWLGAHIPAQAPTLADERAMIEADDRESNESHHYDEPLWRRIADGHAAPTRRMVGGGDPLAPGCPPGGTSEIPACRGPYPELDSQGRGGEESHDGWLGIDSYNGVPQLSADGWTAALIGDLDSTSNVFVVDMHEGLDRVQALRQLTREIPVENVTDPGFLRQYVAMAGDIFDLAISSDGSRIAFTTQRQQFPLAPPVFAELPPVQVGVLELYEIDLSRESLVRVTHGPDDAPSLEGGYQGATTSLGAATPSFAEDGRTLAFADTASNLVSEDANGASDVFTVTEDESPEVPGPVEIGPGPPSLEPSRARWQLSVTPVPRADGDLTLDVVVPGVGELSATVTAGVPITVPSRPRVGSVAAASKEKRPAVGKHVELKTRALASTRMFTALAGLLEVPLRVSPSYAKLLKSAAGIYATVRVTFAGSGRPALTQSLEVSLHCRSARRRSPRKASSRRGRGWMGRSI